METMQTLHDKGSFNALNPYLNVAFIFKAFILSN